MSGKKPASKDDILAFLDSKFAKFDKKPAKGPDIPKTQQKPAKVPQVIEEVKSKSSTPFETAISRLTEQPLTEALLYREMQEQTAAKRTEAIQAFKTTQFKDPND